MPACDECNRQTSKSDLTASIVSRWNYNSTPQEQEDHRRLAAQAKRQAPELIAEWTKQMSLGDRVRAVTHLRAYGVPVPDDAGLASIGPLTIQQLNIFAHKAVLALHFEHFMQPLSNNGRFCAFWRSKEDFASEGVPQILLDMLPGYGTLMQGAWNERETFEYRHAVNEQEGLFGCLAKLRRGLFITGFSVTDAKSLPAVEAAELDWIVPSDLLLSANSPRFQKKL